MKRLTLSLSLFLVILVGQSCSSSNNSEKTVQEENLGEQGTQEKEEENEEEENTVESEFSSAVAQYGQLSVSGSAIVDKDGNPVQLRGMSFFWSQWIGKYYTPQVVQWLKDDWQCTVVRAALAVDEDGGYLFNPEVEKQKVFTVIDAAIEEGLYVLIDWHSHHAEDHLEEAKAFFSEVAEKYGHYPNIIYETYNEPLDVSWNTVLKPYHEEVIAAIREHDPDNIILCGTRNWSQEVSEVIGNTIDDDQVAYVLHYYAATHKQWLRDKAQLAINNNIPLFVTEYGVTQATGDESIDPHEAGLWWDFLDEHKISWCNWSIADKEELAAALKPGTSTLGGWDTDDLTQSGTMVRAELKKKNPLYKKD